MFELTDDLMKEIDELAPPEVKRWTEETMAVVLHLYNKGYSNKEISAFMGKKYPKCTYSSDVINKKILRMQEVV
jgi:hypothetical protein